MSRCKASEIPRSEAYITYAAVTRDEGNAADGRFSTASANVTNMFRMEGMIDTIKSPPAPLFEKGGERLHSGIVHCDHTCADAPSGHHKFPL